MSQVSSPIMVNKDNFPIVFSPKAIEMASLALKETKGEDGEYLRVSIKGGGCAGFQYALNFIKDIDENDIMATYEDLKVVTDIFSATQIGGATVDYIESLQGSGFKFDNPGAKRTCGCGSSFSG